MRTIRYSILALAAIAITVGLGTSAFAFHSGGVADCVGCHSMHSPYPAGDNLLLGGDSSAVCLNCHENLGDSGPSSYHISTPGVELVDGVSPKQRTPGGDFGWLKKTYTWAGRGPTSPPETEEGHTHGHNIIAGSGYSRSQGDVNYGYTVDPVNGAAPGGTFNSNNLVCASCHDPHGTSRRLFDDTVVKPNAIVGGTYPPITRSGSYTNSTKPIDATTAVGVYRILAGPGYVVPGAAFTGAPVAIAPSSYNMSEATNQVKVAYGRGTLTGNDTWSEWCGTCHLDMHYDNGSNYVHPTDEPLNGTTFANYNAYVKTGDLTGGQTTSFTSLVPFTYNTNDYAALMTKAGTANVQAGPDTSNDRVDCLSCHRAHASGWEYALRWNAEYEFLTQSSGAYYDGSFGGRGRTAAEVEDSYYDRPSTVFAASQRALCNKCHVKD
jgi:predicted CXXCH cytochrome family protein